MTDPDIPEQVAYAQEFTVDAGYQRSLAEALCLWQFGAASVWIVVWMSRIRPRRRLAYPRALFPDAEVQRIRSSIAARAVAAGA